MTRLYDYVPHPHIRRRAKAGPVKTADAVPRDSAYRRFNARAGLWITLAVGTMTCGYVFAAVALVSLPAALKTHQSIVIVAWLAQTFFQLVLLPVIIVGQNIQAKASDLRSEQTYRDAEAVLAEALKIQEHLQAQDEVLTALIAAHGG